ERMRDSAAGTRIIDQPSKRLTCCSVIAAGRGRSAERLFDESLGGENSCEEVALDEGALHLDDREHRRDSTDEEHVAGRAELAQDEPIALDPPRQLDFVVAPDHCLDLGVVR